MFRKQNKQQSIKKDLVFIRMNVLSYRDSTEKKATEVYTTNQYS